MLNRTGWLLLFLIAVSSLVYFQTKPGFAIAKASTIAAGERHTIILHSDGTVWAWGNNRFGQLGDGTNINRNNPVQVTGLTGVISVGAGANHSLALKSDGTVWTWGDNGSGQLGDGTTISRTTPGRVPGLDGGSAITAGAGFSLVLKSDGMVWGWGKNTDGLHGKKHSLIYAGPGPVIGLENITTLAAGSNHAVVRLSDGTIRTWGLNDDGQLGNGTQVKTLIPAKVQFPDQLPGVTAIAGGSYHAGLLKSDGFVWTWGKNDYGQLGDGTFAEHHVPFKAGGINEVMSLAGGSNGNFTIKSDGSVWAWGWNQYGQLGDGTWTDRNNPVRVKGLTGIRAVAGGGSHTLALKSDGTVWAWGRNNLGQLGDGTNIDCPAPVLLQDLSGITAIAAGDGHSVALKNDGTVWTWGKNSQGELGDGTTLHRNFPVLVPGLTGVAAIVAGWEHTITLKSDGTVWTWGWNAGGQLGDGTTANRQIPVRVTGLAGVTAISGGYSHSLALRDDGTVWTWGLNNYGQLGDGSDSNRVTPVQAPDLTGVKAITSGYFHTIALQDSGMVMTWGANNHGLPREGRGAGQFLPEKMNLPVSVILKVVDQSGREIRGSRIGIEGTGVFASGSSVDLPPGSWKFTIIPGINGRVGDDAWLKRTETAEVTATTKSIDFQWVIVPVTINLLDQNGNPIPNSYILPDFSGSDWLKAPVSLLLPVTDPEIHPTLDGSYQNGIPFRLAPGIGKTGGGKGFLYRSETLKVAWSSRIVNFEWITTPITQRVVDQNGSLIPDSRVLVGYQGEDWVDTPVTRTFPITDQAIYPTLNGLFRNGYPVEIAPGIASATGSGGSLSRYETMDVSVTTRQVNWEWVIAPVTLNVVDQGGAPITGSLVLIGSKVANWAPTPVKVALPVTDEKLYPSISGPYKKGYPVGIAPGLGVTAGWWGYLSRSETLKVSANTRQVDLEWITTQVTLNVVDQKGDSITNSRIMVGCYAVDWAIPPVRVTLPITDEKIYPTLNGPYKNGYPVGIAPGINGSRGWSGFLSRSENLEVSPANLLINFQWITSPVTFTVVDQNGESIKDMMVSAACFALDWTNIPCAAVFPVTDENLYPAMSGPFKYGYPVSIAPGQNGLEGNVLPRLSRNEVFEVGLLAKTLRYEWVTTTFAVKVLDQNKLPVAGSRVKVDGFSDWLNTPFNLTLPISDQRKYPTINSSGYLFQVAPGRNGKEGNDRYLYRNEVLKITTGMDSAELEWITAPVTVNVVDWNRRPLKNAMVEIDNTVDKVVAPFQVILPVTDDTVYTTLGGKYATGYPLLITPPGMDGFQTATVSTPVKGITKEIAVSPEPELNHRPVLEPPGDQDVKEGEALQLTVHATDSDDEVLTYTAGNLPKGSVFNPVTGIFRWTPDFSQSGRYPGIYFEASDGTLTERAEIAITVENINRSPILNVPSNLITDEGQNCCFTITATDPDHDLLKWKTGDLPEGAVFDYGTGAFSWTPSFNQAGEYSIHCEVSDGDLVEGKDFSITVRDRGTPVRIKLLSSDGLGIAGGAAAYRQAEGWKPIGVTGIDGSAGVLIPPEMTALTVRIVYGGMSQTLVQDISGNSELIFRTRKTTVILKDSSGKGRSFGVVSWGGDSWHTFGTTDSGGLVTKEMLAGRYRFRMKYSGGIQERVQDLGVNPNVQFQTRKITVILENDQGTGLAGGIITCSGTAPVKIGTTDLKGVVTKELLAGVYKFRVERGGKLLEKIQNTGKNSVVRFRMEAL